METGDQPTPSADEARRILEQVETDEQSVRYPTLAPWFFAVMSLALAAIFLAQVLEAPHSLYASFAVAVAAAVLGGRYWFARKGVAWVSVKASDIAPFVIGILVLAVACVIVAELVAADWVWVVGAVLAGGIVWFTGRAYRRAVDARG